MPIIKLMCRTVERKSCLVTLNFNVVFVIVVWVDVYAFYMLIMCGIAFFCSKNYSHSNLFIFSLTSPHNFRVKLFLNFVLHQIQNTSHMLSNLVEEKKTLIIFVRVDWIDDFVIYECMYFRMIVLQIKELSLIL